MGTFKGTSWPTVMYLSTSSSHIVGQPPLCLLCADKCCQGWQNGNAAVVPNYSKDWSFLLAGINTVNIDTGTVYYTMPTLSQSCTCSLIQKSTCTTTECNILYCTSSSAENSTRSGSFFHSKPRIWSTKSSTFSPPSACKLFHQNI